MMYQPEQHKNQDADHKSHFSWGFDGVLENEFKPSSSKTMTKNYNNWVYAVV
jgi:hypothetical protein